MIVSIIAAMDRKRGIGRQQTPLAIVRRFEALPRIDDGPSHHRRAQDFRIDWQAASRQANDRRDAR